MFLISEGMGKLFDDALEALSMEANVPSMWTPPCDLFETPSGFTLKAEVPGIGLDDIVLEVAGDLVTLAGERRKSTEAQSLSYHRMERAGGKFVRVFRLHQQVDEGKVQANLKDGLLTVTIPKKNTSKVVKVEIED
ncbi:MAG: Hsp20/alpha crystallin family protein [Nitrospinota bacterium]|nr:Hsp20/alpha crystallin family protein [Nitrospinota bacterium]MDH5677538.1 Hsp20/alpha crystallin family protein [Nitrospinota bacterium]MDH5757519.1 Hsp20/alpha crystallin family protein [Nitrospinota bacterium]